MIVAVTGGRDYTDRAAVVWALDRLHGDVGVHHVVVGSTGAGDYARGWAWSRGISADRHASPHTLFLMGPVDVLLVFPGSTRTAVEQAEKKGIRVLFYRERDGCRELAEKIFKDEDWMTSTYEDEGEELSPWERISKDEKSLWDEIEEGDL